MASKGSAQLDFAVLTNIVKNGIPKNNLGFNRPFNAHFAKEEILWSWNKVGFVPFTSKTLSGQQEGQERASWTTQRRHWTKRTYNFAPTFWFI